MLEKRTKYRILSRFPGRVGRRYIQKLRRIEEYIATQERFFAALTSCSGMICVDIGANVGDYTKIMARSASQVYAFEPDPIAFSALKDATTGLRNVKLIEAAAGLSNDTIRLYRTKNFLSDPHLQTQASSIYTATHIDDQNFSEIAQIDVTRFLDDLETDIGVIKIDAEGAEVPILEGIIGSRSLLSRIQYIFAETHERYFPELGMRYLAIRERVAEIETPRIDLSWH